MTARPQLPDRAPRTKGAPTALDGLLVVDFTRVVAGPACTQTLADFGAEVIKIENPDGGDDTRHYEHAELAGESAAFVSLNRNKRGIALDLTKPEGCDVARELIARADVVVENFSSGVMKKYGLDYASVAPGNPRLVYCSISAYGRKGPFASRPGFDPITQAESGFMSLNGFPDGPPVRTGPPAVDHVDGHVGLQRHPAGVVRPRSARPRPACRGGAVRHRGGDDAILRHGLFDDRRESEPAGQFAERVSVASASTRLPTRRFISLAPTTGCIAASSSKCSAGPDLASGRIRRPAFTNGQQGEVAHDPHAEFLCRIFARTG